MSFLSKLKSGLSKTSGKLSSGIVGIFTKRKLDNASLEELEELLIEADLGAPLAHELTTEFAKQRFDKNIEAGEVREFLAGKIADILKPYSIPLTTDHRPLTTIIMVGVNGNGKTTTIGKLASKFKNEGKKVMIAAADTFRAAAVEQIQVWGERSGIPVVTGAFQADPASVAFQALERARAENIDVLFIDTAGRLQNKSNLMAELQKIIKVLKKIDESAPHHVLQVLDATTGQNALSQVSTFKEMVNVTGLIITKLDGTAKGGIVVALARESKLPIHAIGIGEAIDDLDAFNPEDFARNLVDL
ncbi:MAG: signal recognition particle-docking protein FtsY [Rickettsiales bacterium]